LKFLEEAKLVYEQPNKVINVPQGYGALLRKETTITRNIKGLYTSSFIASIVACIGENTIALAHFDLHTPPALLNKMIDATKVSTIVVCSREGDQIVKSNILEYIKKNLPEQKVIHKDVHEKITGIVISFESSSANTIHPQLQRLTSHQQPKEGSVLHHPQEFQFGTVQKIEELIGFRARRKKKGKSNERNLFIFDGAHWESMANSLKVDDSDSLTKQELEFFGRDNTFYIIMQKIPLLVQEFKVEDIFGRRQFKRIAMALETYFNNFDIDVIYRRNLKDSLTCDFNRSLVHTPADRKMSNKIVTLLDQKGALPIEEIRKIYDAYEQTADKSAYKSQMEVEYFGILLHYYERRQYHDYAAEIKKIKTKAVEANAAGVKEYKGENYAGALEKFNEVLTHLTVVATKIDPLIATCYFNIGKSLFNLKEYTKALPPLRTSLELNKLQKKETDKIEKVIEECESKSQEK